MKAAKHLIALSEPPSQETISPTSLGTSMTPTFEIHLRRRHDETAPVDVIRVPARTIASARHAARLAHPDTVILSVKRV